MLYVDGQLLQCFSTVSKTEVSGTLCLNRKDIPKIARDKKLKKGEIIAQHSGQISAPKWSGKKKVTMISTYYGDNTLKVKKGYMKRRHLHQSCILTNTRLELI
jgi:hypothetical protein